MRLVIDSGNTNVVFAVYDGERKRGMWRATSESRRTADEYAVWLTQLMALEGIERRDITAAAIANVVPMAAFNLKALCRRYFDCVPVVIGEPDTDVGIAIKVDRPEEVGADRIVNTVGLKGRFPLPAIVIDFGTATTFDVVDGDGNYCGGVIAPGINLSMEALHMAAAKLPRIEIKRPDRVIGRTTVTCMQSGVFWGYIGLIEGLVSRTAAEFGGKMAVVATGGLAPLFADSTKVIEHIDPDLTLIGLLQILDRNRPGAA